VFKPPRRRRSGASSPGLVGDHADKLSRIQPITPEVAEAVSAPPAGPRLATRWYFASALVLGALAIFVLPTPFSGIASLACVGAFVTGGVRRINGGDPEMVKRTTGSGIIGGGG
jgi:hypothetical protein